MSIKEAVTNPDAFWGKVNDGMSAYIKTYRRKRAVTSLEGDLCRLLKTAKAHSSKGKKPGDPVFIELSRRADVLLDGFCDQWGADQRRSIEVQVPALRDLKQLTQPVAGIPFPVIIVGASIGLFSVCALLGVVSGSVHVFYESTVHFMVYVLHLKGIL